MESSKDVKYAVSGVCSSGQMVTSNDLIELSSRKKKLQ